MVEFRAVVLLVTASLGLVQAQTTKCTVNNCLRQVKAESFPWRPIRADCASFLLTKITPAVSTVSVFKTVTATETAVVTSLATRTIQSDIVETETVIVATVTEAAAPIEAREEGIPDTEGIVAALPSGVPTYASACTSSADYSSACSCIGVTAAVTTVRVPPTTTTVTVVKTTTKASTTPVTTLTTVVQTTTTTESATETVTEVPQATPFYLQIVGGAADGQRVVVDINAQPQPEGPGTPLTVDAEGHLAFTVGEDIKYANVNPGPEAFLIYFDPESLIGIYGYKFVNCNKPEANATLQCSFGNLNTFLYCPKDNSRIMLSTPKGYAECEPITLKVILQ